MRSSKYIESNYEFSGTILIIVLLLLSSASFAENILSLKGDKVLQNNVVEISIDVKNDEEFVSFQCDILLPDGFSYVEESGILTERAGDHVMNVSSVSANRLRVFAYSLNNNAFVGDTGSVACLQLLSGDQSGMFNLLLEKVIIGNAASNNILTDFNHGQIEVVPTSIEELSPTEDGIIFYPNPATEIIRIKFQNLKPVKAEFQILSLNGNASAMMAKTGFVNNDNEVVLEVLSLNPGIYLLNGIVMDEKGKNYALKHKMIIKD